MARSLTVKFLNAVKPTRKRVEIADALAPSLYFICQPSGVRSWAVRYRFEGRSRKHTLGPFPALALPKARELARKAMSAVAEGVDPGEQKKAKIVARRRDTVEAVTAKFVDRYLAAKNRPSSAKETERLLTTKVLPAWRGREIASIGKRDVLDLLDSISDAGAPVSANRTLAALRRMMNWAIERDILQSSPCKGVVAPTAEVSRDRILTDDEIRLFWKGCDALGWPFGPMMKLLLLTAQRRSEVSAMRWTEIVGNEWVIPSARTKNGIEQTVPLSAQALAILDGLPRIKSRQRFVFTTSGASAVSGFSRAKRRLDSAVLEGMRRAAADAGEAKEATSELTTPDWRIHDLRRSAASGMARIGVDQVVVEKILNHVSGSLSGVGGIYNRFEYAERRRAALEAWGNFVENLVSDAAPDNVVSIRKISG